MDTQRNFVPSSERNMSLTETMQLAGVFFKSAMFADVKSEAAATVIIMAGRELGFSAMASMMGINVVFGKPSLSADLMAALVKKDSRYNFHIVTHTANECTIEFMENGKICHTEKYTISDAALAGLTEKPIWKKNPRDMLYARCISKGANIVCPQRLAGLDISEEMSAPAEPVEATPEAADTATEELTGEKRTQSVEQNTPNGPAHTPVNAMLFQTYIADAKVLGRFWGWCKGLGLNEADVHTALNVEHLADVTGTVAQVKAVIDAYAKSKPVEKPSFAEQDEEDQAPKDTEGHNE